MSASAVILNDAAGPLVVRTTDAAVVNAVFNHPAVFPTLSLGVEGPLDMSPLLESPRNLCFMGEHGGAILVWTGPGVYDAHDFILPEGRGRWAKIACRQILDLAFDTYGARMVWAQTPVENRACRMFNRILGFRSQGVETAVLIPGSDPQPVEIFIMEASCL